MAFSMEVNGDTVFYRVLPCTDQKVVAPHPSRSGQVAALYWVVSDVSDEGKDVPVAAQEAIVKKFQALADWVEVSKVPKSGKKGGRDTILVRLAAWQNEDESYPDEISVELPKKGSTPKAVYQAKRKQGCIFCFRPFCAGRDAKKGCMILNHVNSKRQELHPDWEEVTVTEDFEIVWRDVSRPINAADFHVLKARVDALEADKAALELRLKSLETPAQAQKSAEPAATSTTETTAQKRKADGTNQNKKKSKKAKAEAKPAATTSSTSGAGPSKST
ncbi:hypothetical protein K466DRAFT_657229 [Polyporus arcularius HHB13444]|uniref:Uncharacterized protein n=1 Tax=Polyporus arcularius HHB13444 TaxID=1314778 RepID=A0A5C3NKY7_9APHY|nr:hypothetical protein K466DRAFT_657229 [Polyporus arcularius HHB13444]